MSERWAILVARLMRCLPGAGPRAAAAFAIGLLPRVAADGGCIVLDDRGRPGVANNRPLRLRLRERREVAAGLSSHGRVQA